MKIKNSGFTIVETLLIVAVVGMLLSIIVVILGSLQFKDQDIQQLHDARRLSDVTQLRTALDLFFANAGGYPDQHLWITGQTIGCGKSTILQIPRDPLLKSGGNTYIYKNVGKASDSKSCLTQVYPDYSLQFQTETKSYLGPAGIYCQTSNKGIFSGYCP